MTVASSRRCKREGRSTRTELNQHNDIRRLTRRTGDLYVLLKSDGGCGIGRFGRLVCTFMACGLCCETRGKLATHQEATRPQPPSLGLPGARCPPDPRDQPSLLLASGREAEVARQQRSRLLSFFPRYRILTHTDCKPTVATTLASPVEQNCSNGATQRDTYQDRHVSRKSNGASGGSACLCSAPASYPRRSRDSAASKSPDSKPIEPGQGALRLSQSSRIRVPVPGGRSASATLYRRPGKWNSLPPPPTRASSASGTARPEPIRSITPRADDLPAEVVAVVVERVEEDESARAVRAEDQPHIGERVVVPGPGGPVPDELRIYRIRADRAHPLRLH